MARKKHREEFFICPLCQKEGSVEFEENETPPHHSNEASSYDETLKAISKGFTATRNVNGTYTIKCSTCKVPVHLVVDSN